MSLTKLCQITRNACDLMVPIIQTFYGAINSETSKLKADKSVFTIADGIVQHLLSDRLFGGGKFRDIIGEEDESSINIINPPYNVDDLLIPTEFYSVINSLRDSIDALSHEIEATSYNHLTVFIDPIDGTREFSNNKGDQCSVCVGFSDMQGQPLAGVVYRPLTLPQPTWAVGARSEAYNQCYFMPSADASCSGRNTISTTDTTTAVASMIHKGLLTSNGNISPFLTEFMKDMNYDRIPSGGAGNKILMLLEGKGSAYIQDRGVSRWDTCAAQAVLEAHGGTLSKLTKFIDHKKLESYTYLKSDINLDFEQGKSSITSINRRREVSSSSKPSKATSTVADVQDFKPYSNLCGLVALSHHSCSEPSISHIHQALISAACVVPPAYD